MSILIENLNKQFDGKNVLQNFSYEFQENKVTCIMGKSGIGKTTLLSILMGLEKQDSGKITGMRDKKLSAVFQENRLLENLDAVTNISVATGKNEQQIEKMLSDLKLDAPKGQPIREYSGGMKRRVTLARALLADFDILIMDEPLQGLDEDTKSKVIEVIKKQIQNKTVLMVTHDVEESRIFDAELLEMN